MSLSKQSPDLFGFTEKQWGTLTELFLKHPAIQKATLFGSRAKGNYKAASDVDLAIEGTDLDISTLLRFQADLEESTLPYFFDVIDLKMVDSNELLQHIQEFGVTIYDSKA